MAAMAMLVIVMVVCVVVGMVVVAGYGGNGFGGESLEVGMAMFVVLVVVVAVVVVSGSATIRKLTPNFLCVEAKSTSKLSRPLFTGPSKCAQCNVFVGGFQEEQLPSMVVPGNKYSSRPFGGA